MTAAPALIGGDSAPKVARGVDPGHWASVVHAAGYCLSQQPDTDAAYSDVEAYETAVAKCTNKELRLAVELAKGKQLAEALHAAGYRSSGGATRYQTKLASDIRRRPHVVAVERGMRRAALFRAEIDAGQVTAELARIAFSSVNHYEVDDAGRVQLAPGAPLDAVQAVSSVEVDETVTQTETATITRRKKRLKLHPKVAALAKLAETLGMVQTPGASANVGVQIIVQSGELGMQRAEPIAVLGAPAVETGSSREDDPASLDAQVVTPFGSALVLGPGHTNGEGGDE